MIVADRITVGHLKRKAYLHVRQSTLYQTEQNPESLQRQYDFREQALSLGWHEDQIAAIPARMVFWGHRSAQVTWSSLFGAKARGKRAKSGSIGGHDEAAGG